MLPFGEELCGFAQAVGLGAERDQGAERVVDDFGELAPGGVDTDARDDGLLAFAGVLAHLTTYAEAAGRAFQLADDILDVTASAAALGKATGKDASKGKQTIVARIGVDAARRQLAEIIHDALSALIPVGPEANGLRETAKFFAEREH